MNNKEIKNEFVIVRVSSILKDRLVEISICEKITLSSYVRITLLEASETYFKNING